jgi:hypothetical protein
MIIGYMLSELVTDQIKEYTLLVNGYDSVRGTRATAYGIPPSIIYLDSSPKEIERHMET